MQIDDTYLEDYIQYRIQVAKEGSKDFLGYEDFSNECESEDRIADKCYSQHIRSMTDSGRYI